MRTRTIKRLIRAHVLRALGCGRSRRNDYNESRIVLLCQGGFFYGNAILLEPTIRLLRRNLPGAHLALVGSDAYCEVFNPMGLLDNLIPWGDMRTSHYRYVTGLEFWAYDVIFQTYGACLLPLAEVILALGRELWLTESRVSLAESRLSHETDESLAVLSLKLNVDISEADRWPCLHLSRNEMESGRRILAESTALSHPFIGIHAGAGPWHKWKRWPAGNFVLLGKKVFSPRYSPCKPRCALSTQHLTV